MKKPIYRRAYEGETWHWCTNCSEWPQNDYTIRHYLPQRDAPCPECRKLDDEGKCERA